MRSKLLLCAALVGTCAFSSWSPAARAADPKGKKAKSGDSLSDDKVISKQMQWEDSVMGPDDKRAELDKIARAQAINKAAAEKAAKEKEKADAQAAKEAAAPKPQTSKRGGDVALPSLGDEDSGKGSRGKSSEVSPKLETAAAAAPPPPVKHGDDKFIDKLLTNDSGTKKHKASAADDKALDDLLAVEKPKPAAKGQGKGRKDDVDSLLLSADKAPPMPETHVKHETPEWAKPEIASTPVQAPMPVRPQPKRDDGIIHVVQGAAPAGRPVTVSQRTVAPPPPARSNAVATRAPAGKRQAAPAGGGGWNDPFATGANGQKKTVAARETHRDDSGADDLDGEIPVNRRQPAAAQRRGTRDADDDGDSFKNAKATGGTRRAAPAAKPPKWKDPFTESETPAPARSKAIVATRESRKAESRKAAVFKAAPAKAALSKPVAAKETSKWDVAQRHEATVAMNGPRARSGRWGVLKKHAH
jgi:hypothetical protein